MLGGGIKTSQKAVLLALCDTPPVSLCHLLRYQKEPGGPALQDANPSRRTRRGVKLVNAAPSHMTGHILSRHSLVSQVHRTLP